MCSTVSPLSAHLQGAVQAAWASLHASRHLCMPAGQSCLKVRVHLHVWQELWPAHLCRYTYLPLNMCSCIEQGICDTALLCLADALTTGVRCLRLTPAHGA